MSNPGVITLTQKELSPTKSFRVEDNLAEAIHFHYNDIRIDLSIAELMYLAKESDDIIYDLVKAKNFNLDDYNQDFLNDYSQVLIDLISVEKEVVSVSDLYYQTVNGIGLPVKRKVKKTAQSYENNDKYLPVLFNDNTVFYGTEQISSILKNDENAKTEVIRWKFENGKHTVSKHPWIPYLFKWDKKRLIKTAKKFAMKVLG